MDSSARLWDTRTGEAFLSPLRHDGEVFMARFSQDGLRLVTSSRDKSARLWDARKAQALGEPMRHEQNVLMAKLGAGGQRVVTLSESDQAWLWDVRTVQPTVLCWLSVPAKFVSFSSDGQKLLVVDEGDGTRVCNAEFGNLPGRIRPAPKAVHHCGCAFFSRWPSLCDRFRGYQPGPRIPTEG